MEGGREKEVEGGREKEVEGGRTRWRGRETEADGQIERERERQGKRERDVTDNTVQFTLTNLDLQAAPCKSIVAVPYS